MDVLAQVNTESSGEWFVSACLAVHILNCQHALSRAKGKHVLLLSPCSLPLHAALHSSLLAAVLSAHRAHASRMYS
jgi:hypothetical protein